MAETAGGNADQMGNSSKHPQKSVASAGVFNILRFVPGVREKHCPVINKIYPTLSGWELVSTLSQGRRKKRAYPGLCYESPSGMAMQMTKIIISHLSMVICHFC